MISWWTLLHHFNWFLNLPKPKVMPLTRPELAQIHIDNRFARFQTSTPPYNMNLWLPETWLAKKKQAKEIMWKSATIPFYPIFIPSLEILVLISYLKFSPPKSFFLTGSWQRSWFMTLRFLNLSKSNPNFLVVCRHACLYVCVACVRALVCARRSEHAEMCSSKYEHRSVHVEICAS